MDKQGSVWTDEQIREYSNQITSSGFLNGWIFNLVRGIRDEVLNAWQADHDQLQAKLDAAQQRIAELEAWIEERQPRRDDSDDRIDESEADDNE